MSRRGDKPEDGRLSTSASRTGLATASSPGWRPAATRNVTRRSGDSQQGLSPQFLIHSLLHWWKAAVPVGLLLAVAGAAAVWWLFEPVYFAQALIQIRETPPALVFEVETPSRGYVETQKEILRSVRVLRPVVHSGDVKNLPELRDRKDKAQWLRSQLTLESVGQSEFMRVGFEGPNAENAARIVNAVVQQYFTLLTEVNDERVARIIALLDREITNRKANVEQRRQTLQKRALSETGKDPFSRTLHEGASWPHPLAELQGKLTEAEVEREVLEAELKAIEEMPGKITQLQIENLREKISKAIQDNYEIRALEERMVTSRMKLRDMEARTAKPSKDAACRQMAEDIGRDQQRIEELKKSLDGQYRAEFQKTLIAEREGELARKKMEIDRGRRMEQALRERYEKEMKKIVPGVADQVSLEFDQAELVRATEVLNRIEQRVVELRTERQAPARVLLFDRARPPEAPVMAVPYTRMGLAVLIGFCAPFGLAIGWERVVRRISGAEQLEQETHLAVIGEIARLPERHTRSQPSASRRMAQKLRLYEESVDSMRTFLVLAEGLRSVKILAVTSATSNEGKTSVAAQLALSLARASGKPTLLIDGDMRAPDLQNVFEVARSPGLAEVLIGDCTLEAAIVHSWTPRVDVLPAGQLKASPHQVVGNGAFQAVLEWTSREYAYIVLDTPPILAAAESLVFAKAADVSLLCAMQDVSRSGQVKKACERLEGAGCRPVAAVLNGVSPHHYRYHYGQYDYSSSQ